VEVRMPALQSKKNIASIYDVKLFIGVDGLERLESDWHRITDNCPQVAFYNRYEWYRAYLEHLEPQCDRVYFFLVVRIASQEPVAIVPLKHKYLRRCGIRLRVWRTPRTVDLDLSDIITINRESVIPVCQAVLCKLRSAKELHFDAIFLDRIVEQGNAWNLIAEKSIRHKLVTRTMCSKFLRCVAADAEREDFGTGKFRRNLRRLEKRLCDQGEIDYAYVQDVAGMRDAYQQFLQVEAAGWKGGCGARTAIVLKESVRAFYRELLETFGKLGRCRINLMRLNGEVVAAQYCLLDDGRINLLKIGHDTRYQNCSPGFLLIKRVFEKECCGAGAIKELSFVTGYEWQDIFRPGRLDVFSVYIFNSTIKGRIVYFLWKLKKILKKHIHSNNFLAAHLLLGETKK
jgi:CelD/BcsL family acetyltransferase involved in cellulose biosynthesis